MSIFTALVWLLIAIFVPPFIDDKITDGVEAIVLTTPDAKAKNDVGWRQFVDNSQPDSNPLYQEVRFWNITNPNEVLQGAKAHVVELGPYVYRANQRRINTTFYIDRSGQKQVRFKMYRWFTFEPSMSGDGLDPLNDVVTSANVIFQATAIQSPSLVFNIYEDYTPYNRMFATRKVHWWIFGGRSLNIPFMFFPGFTHNDTFDVDVEQAGWCSQYTGEDHLFQAQLMTEWKGFTSIIYNSLPYPAIGPMLPPWGNDQANKLHGTHGDSFAPLNSYGKGDTVPVYVDDLYMSLGLANINDETIKVKGVELVKFRLTEKLLQNSITNPFNKPYYMDGPNGFFNLTTPKIAPMFVSMPNFLYVDKDVADLVTGMAPPTEEKHSTWLGVEPYTGMTLSAQKTWQINVPLKPMVVFDPDHKNYTWFPNVTKGLYLPMAWMKYGGEMNDDIANIIKGQVYLGVTARSVMKWLGFGVGLVCLGFGLIMLLSAMKELQREQRGKSRVVSAGSRPYRGYKRVSEG